MRAAQDAVAQLVPNVYEVDTDNLPLRPDLLHYTSDGEIELGDLFAYGVINMTIAVPQPASIGILVVAGSESLESFVNTRIKD